MSAARAIARQIIEELRRGRPQEVAEKIAKGELDMRPEAVAERREDLFPTRAYHGGEIHWLEMDPDKGSKSPTLWAADDPILSNTYITHGEPVQGIQPLALNIADFLRIEGDGHIWSNLAGANAVKRGGERIALPNDRSLTTDMVTRQAGQNNYPGVVFEGVVDPGPNFNAAQWTFTDDSGRRVWSADNPDYDLAAEFDQWAADYDEYGGTQYAVLDPSRIRSYLSAAFDPDYKGPNILGEYVLPGALALGAAGAALTPQDAEAGPIMRNGRRMLEAWHGSPHTFDQFSMDAIGTGEGAQAFGHGLYFADAEDVAKGYRYADRLAPRLLAALSAGAVAGPFAYSEAEEMLRSGLEAARYGEAKAPESETVGSMVNALRSAGRSLEGSPASLLYPEGTVDYIDTINRRGEEPDWEDRILFALDWLPI